MAQSITLSSAGTATLVLNPVSKSTTVVLTGTVNSTTTTVQVEMSVDDPTIPGGPTATWALLSSATAMIGSSTTSALSLVYTVLSPMGMVRLNSTTAAGSSVVFTLKALQAVVA